MVNQPARKTCFGLAASIFGILCALSLMSNYGSSQLNISQETFNLLNNLTALLYCILTPLAFVLGAIGLTRKSDSKILSLIGILLAVIPFLITAGGLISSFVR